MGEKWEEYIVNNGSIHIDLSATKGVITVDITGTEIRNRAV